MATFLLFVIYAAFIGLGVPDSLFGTAWPAIYAEFGLPLSWGSFVTVTVCCGTVLSSIISGPVIRRFGTGRVAAVSTAMTAAALLGFSVCGSFWFFFLWALPLGLGAGAIDTGLNHYVSLHYSAAQMNFLHCFYGVGISISPYILSQVLAAAGGWRAGYRIAAGLQLGIALLLFATLPLWARAHGRQAQELQHSEKAVGFLAAARLRGVREMCLLFFASCGIEALCSGWASTFFVEARGMAPAGAARAVTFYYVGIALGRFGAGLLAMRLGSWAIVRLGQGVLAAAMVLLLAPGPDWLAATGLFLVGLGNSPLFPNFTYLTPANFGPEAAQAAMSVQMATSYLGSMALPVVFGQVGQRAGMWLFPICLAGLFLLMMAVDRAARRILHARGR